MFSDHLDDIAEIQWRFSPAIAIIVLGMLAIPLSHSAPRESRGGRVILGILTYTIYANILYMWRSWIANGDLPPVLGLWWVHLLVFITAMAWLKRQHRMVGKG
jgi:lipopolysaccharide export system permease protein